MYVRRILPFSLAALAIAIIVGCQRAETHSAASWQPPELSSNTIVRIHWLGKRRLGVKGSAYYFMRLWNLPESRRLERQTLDKLSVFPWRFTDAKTTPMKAGSNFLRPLVDDIVSEETYIEGREISANSTAWVLAVKLDEKQAGRWYTNLAGAVQSLTGVAPISTPETPANWVAKQPPSRVTIQLTRVGKWTILGAAEDGNPLLAEVTSRTQREGAPFPASDAWLTADLALGYPVVASELAVSRPEKMPRISFSLNGDGAHVLCRGRIIFPAAFSIEQTPWTVPTNLMYGPLTSFTALRGVSPCLKSWSFWNRLLPGVPPNQFFKWSESGGRFRTYVAAPMQDATTRVRKLTVHFLSKSNPWLKAHGYVGFDLLPNGDGVSWGNLPNLRPFVRSFQGQPDFIYAGLVPEMQPAGNAPFPEKVAHPLTEITNLVYYDWEATAARLEPCFYIAQNIRVISRHAQLPMNSVSAAWLGSLLLRLDDSETVVTRTGPSELTFSRKSSIGLTASELQLLADWLESPRFPTGLHSVEPSAPRVIPSGQSPK